MSERRRDETDRTLIGGGSVLGLAGVLAVTTGVPGVFAGATVAATWYLLPVPYAVVTGHLALAILLPDEPGALPLLLAEVGLVGALVGPALAANRPLGLVGQTVIGTVVLGALAWAWTNWWDPIWVSASLLAVAIGALSYGLGEYERYALRRPETSEEPS